MAKHIGIVGCSPPGAALCYQTICTEAQQLGADGMSLEVSMHSHPIEMYVHYIRLGDWEGVANLMLSSAAKLSDVGAEILVAPCNTVHLHFEMVESRSPAPWLHIADEVALEANRLGYQKVGLLGTRLLMESAIYPERFEKVGIESHIPEQQSRVLIDHYILNEMVYGRFSSEARSHLLHTIKELQIEGCDAVGMCCTELPILIGDEPASLPLLDSTRILARAAARRACMGLD